jgi:redox-regulated HSP33 family molecular chaperone
LAGAWVRAMLLTRTLMLPVETKIDRAQRLLRMIEQDAPLLAVRVAPLSRECQESAMSHAKSLAALTRAELQRLLKEKATIESGDLVPQAAD